MTISGRTRLAGVMGWPVLHSRSPWLHNYWLELYRIDGVYVPFAVRPEHIDQALAALPKLGMRGVNVTIPHKEAAYSAADRHDAFARRVGAANTIVVAEDGALLASNTDGFGFIENLRQSIAGWSIAGKAAVVLGAGGAARAIAAALQDDGAVEIRLVNRTAERSRSIAGALGRPLIAVPWQERSAALAGAALLVNTTSLGMVGQPPLALALDELPADAVVNDIVYSPLETPLLAAASARGNSVVDGLGMLFHQARPGFSAWFDRSPDVTPELRRHMLEASSGT